MEKKLIEICKNYNNVLENKVKYWYQKCNFQCDGKDKECTAYNGVKINEALWKEYRLDK